MKKLFVISSLFLLAGCSEPANKDGEVIVVVTPDNKVDEKVIPKKQEVKEAPYVGFLITVGYGKEEWYISNKAPSFGTRGEVYIETSKGTISTNNVVASYPFYSEKHLNELKDKFGLK